MKNLILLFVALVLFSCKPQQKNNVQELFEIDLQFSAAAVEKGFNKAFIEYAHTNAVLLRENSMPVVGKPAITQLFENASAEGIDFTWKPIAGDIAESGELGYTYGTFLMKIDTIVQKGTYVSIWKKDDKGNWKYVLDSGNEGLEN